MAITTNNFDKRETLFADVCGTITTFQEVNEL